MQVKKKPGTEPDKFIITAIVPAEEASLIPYHTVEDEDRSDCLTIGLEDSDIEEINKTEVKSALKVLTELRHKEADCIDKLAQAVPEMEDNEVVTVSEKIQGMDLPSCVYDIYDRIGNPRNFRAALTMGELLLSLYKNQVGADVETIPNLYTYFDVGKTELHEILCCQKYGKEEPDVKKPPKCITTVPVKEEKKTKGPPAKKARGKKSPNKSSEKEPKKSKKKTPVTTTKPSTT